MTNDVLDVLNASDFFHTLRNRLMVIQSACFSINDFSRTSEGITSTDAIGFLTGETIDFIDKYQYNICNKSS